MAAMAIAKITEVCVRTMRRNARWLSYSSDRTKRDYFVLLNRMTIDSTDRTLLNHSDAGGPDGGGFSTGGVLPAFFGLTAFQVALSNPRNRPLCFLSSRTLSPSILVITTLMSMKAAT